MDGLAADAFAVQVGGEAASTISAAYVQDQYWLVVQPPTQTVTGDPPWLFDLDVTLEGLSDHEDDAVHYTPQPHYDEALVVDTSGSMGSPPGYTKLLAAQNAAKLFIDELADGDRMESEIVVHTVALGPGSHEELMQRIARDSGGEYIFATVTDMVMASAAPAISSAGGRVPGTTQPATAPAGPQQVTGWELGLSDIYDYLESRVEGGTRVYREQFSAPALGTYSTTLTLDESISHATFAVAHDTSAGDVPRRVWLMTPAGTTISSTLVPAGAAYRADDSHNVYEIPAPPPGPWQVWVTYYAYVTPPPPPYNFLVAVSGQSSTALEVYVGAPVEGRVTGSPIPVVVAFLGPDGLLPGATMTASVAGNGASYPLTLRDDGRRGDGEAGDGVYGAYFTRAVAEGSFTLHVEGQRGDVIRQAMASFHVRADEDSDGDGMPDRTILSSLAPRGNRMPRPGPGS